MSQKPIETNNMMSVVEFEEELAKHMPFIKEHIFVLNWGVVVAPLMPRTKSAGGIALPQVTLDAEQYLTFIGKLLLIGADYYQSERLKPYKDLAPRVGDYVMFKKYGGIPVNYRGIKLLHMNDDELLWEVSDVDNFRMYV